jgi:hypothetical protein
LGKELLFAMAMEGKFSGEGLNSMGDEDMMTSLARELVEEGGVGASATQIWSDLRAQREKMLSVDDASTYRLELNVIGRQAGEVVEVHRSRMYAEHGQMVTEPKAMPLSAQSIELGPVFTWGTELERCRRAYPLKIRSRPKPNRSGQLSLFCALG